MRIAFTIAELFRDIRRHLQDNLNIFLKGFVALGENSGRAESSCLVKTVMNLKFVFVHFETPTCM